MAMMAARRGDPDKARNLYTDALDWLRANGAAEAGQVAAALAALEEPD